MGVAPTERAEQVELVVAAVRLVGAADLSACGHADLDVLAGALQRIRGFVSVGEVWLARRRDELTAHMLHGIAAVGSSSGSASDATSHGADGSAESPIEGGNGTEGSSGAEGPGPLDGQLAASLLGGARDRRPGRDAGLDRCRADVCAAIAGMEVALAAGRIDRAHVDAVVGVWRDLDEAERAALGARSATVVERAVASPPERFARWVRDLGRQLQRDHGRRVAERQRAAANVRRWIDGRTGMGHLHAELDPEATARLWAALDARVADVKARPDTAGVPVQRLEVDALVELVTASVVVDRRVPELSVVVDWDTLRSGVFGAGSICETSDGQALAPATVRRLACEATLLPVVLGGDGVPLDVGRSQRLATPGQRRALAAMYATCALPGCATRFGRCVVHHVDPWLPTGPTDLDNLLPLCDRHHHQVHEGGWRLTMTTDRRITLHRPDGSVEYCGDSRDRLGADDLSGRARAVTAREPASVVGPGVTDGFDHADRLDHANRLDHADCFDDDDGIDHDGVDWARLELEFERLAAELGDVLLDVVAPRGP